MTQFLRVVLLLCLACETSSPSPSPFDAGSTDDGSLPIGEDFGVRTVEESRTTSVVDESSSAYTTSESCSEERARAFAPSDQLVFSDHVTGGGRSVGGARVETPLTNALEASRVHVEGRVRVDRFRAQAEAYSFFFGGSGTASAELVFLVTDRRSRRVLCSTVQRLGGVDVSTTNESTEIAPGTRLSLPACIVDREPGARLDLVASVTLRAVANAWGAAGAMVDARLTMEEVVATSCRRTLAWCNGAGERLLLGDVNGDGLDDGICHRGAVIAVDHATEAAGIAGRDDLLVGTLSGPFCATGALRVADVNGDRRADLLCHEASTGSVRITYASTLGTFDGWTDRSVAGFCGGAGGAWKYQTLYLAELDDNTTADLVCHDRRDGRLRLGRDGGLFPVENLPPLSCEGRLVGFVDVNGDGRQDRVCHSTSGRLEIDLAEDRAAGDTRGWLAGTDTRVDTAFCPTGRIAVSNPSSKAADVLVCTRSDGRLESLRFFDGHPHHLGPEALDFCATPNASVAVGHRGPHGTWVHCQNRETGRVEAIALQRSLPPPSIFLPLPWMSLP